MVQIYFTDEGGELRIDMLGHADLKNIEKLDVLCAACTTLADSLSLMAMVFDESEMLEEPATIYVGDDGEGKARILCKPKPEFYRIVRTAFDTASAGFSYLSTFYPEHVAFVRE